MYVFQYFLTVVYTCIYGYTDRINIGSGSWNVGGVDDDNNSETWLLAHIWTIVDRAFNDVQLDVVR